MFKNSLPVPVFDCKYWSQDDGDVIYDDDNDVGNDDESTENIVFVHKT